MIAKDHFAPAAAWTNPSRAKDAVQGRGIGFLAFCERARKDETQSGSISGRPCLPRRRMAGTGGTGSGISTVPM